MMNPERFANVNFSGFVHFIYRFLGTVLTVLSVE